MFVCMHQLLAHFVMPLLRFEVLFTDTTEDGIDWNILADLWDSVKNDKSKCGILASEFRLAFKRFSTAADMRTRLSLMQLLSILEACILNCGPAFQHTILSNAGLINELYGASCKQCQLNGVKQRFLSLLQDWHDMFRERTEYQKSLHVFYQSLRAKGEEFPMRDVTMLRLSADVPSSAIEKPAVRTMEELNADLHQTEVNFNVMRQLVEESHEISTEDLHFIHELHRTNLLIFPLLQRLMHQTLTVPPPELFHLLDESFVNRLLDLHQHVEQSLSAAENFIRSHPLPTKVVASFPGDLPSSRELMRRLPVSVEEIYSAQEEASELSLGIQEFLVSKARRRSSAAPGEKNDEHDVSNTSSGKIAVQVGLKSSETSSTPLLHETDVQTTATGGTSKTTSAAWRSSRFLTRPRINDVDEEEGL